MGRYWGDMGRYALDPPRPARTRGGGGCGGCGGGVGGDGGGVGGGGGGGRLRDLSPALGASSARLGEVRLVAERVDAQVELGEAAWSGLGIGLGMGLGLGLGFGLGLGVGFAR